MTDADGMKTKPPSRGRRVLALIRKESIQIIRDPSSIIIAGVLPLLLLFLFSYGVSLDLRNIDVAVVIERPSPQATRFLQSFQASRYFRVQVARDRREVQDKLVAGRLQGVVVLATDFAQRIGRGDVAPVQVIVRGTDPNTGALVENYVQGAWQSWLGQEALLHGQTVGGVIVAPDVTIVPQPRIWFNPNFDSRAALLPGSLAVIMTLIGTLLTALVVAREWERGTMEAMLATPASKGELLLGKFVPYFVLGMGAMALSVAVAHRLLGVPLHGSLLVLAAVSAIFLSYALGLGLLISTLTRNQFIASELALITGFLPAFQLSGLVFEIDSMPRPIRLLTYVLPPRYFVTDLQTIFLAGDVWRVLIPNTSIIAAFAMALIALTLRSTKGRLE
ncbi:MAG: ABC transporter permease [Planctomycetota bacterium]|nr:ABC transporter permease [Planctomycetota bacterium]